MKVVFTTNPGLEDVAAEEVSEWGVKILSLEEGRAEGLWEGDLEDLVWKLERSNTIHKAFALFYEGDFEKVDLSWVKEFITPHADFAVRAQRIGEGPESPEIARIIGEKVIDEVKKFYGSPPKVNLDYPSIVIVAEWRFGKLRVGLLLSGEESLHRRYYRVYEHMASLKPTIAYSMLKMGEAERAQVLVDPMCGSGTIAIEATKFLVPKIYCFDIKEKYVKIAKMNAKVALVDKMIEFDVWDARRLHERVEGVDLIVTNPPYGVRMGSPKKVLKLYEEFAFSAFNALKEKGKVVMITPLRETEEIFEERGFEIVEKRNVYHGDLWVKLFIFKKP
ncbi:rRNA (guanine-N2)-methyltransferase [Ignicoccus pacificus DSM 13166]|uniref:rRNA (Guanine-N2)-methyltransferase n=1 Tax=Ignicoccus pacificus DSM 13166 TaxID=940294 RepID=A0A977KAE8_9CREN|nr:rRNA (guanine-N2)-methyltransferase [Ignicoccus pacificus DSM 13166]